MIVLVSVEFGYVSARPIILRRAGIVCASADPIKIITLTLAPIISRSQHHHNTHIHPSISHAAYYIWCRRVVCSDDVPGGFCVFGYALCYGSVPIANARHRKRTHRRAKNACTKHKSHRRSRRREPVKWVMGTSENERRCQRRQQNTRICVVVCCALGCFAQKLCKSALSCCVHFDALVRRLVSWRSTYQRANTEPPSPASQPDQVT